MGIQIQEMPVSSAIMSPWNKEVVVHDGEIEVKGKSPTTSSQEVTDSLRLGILRRGPLARTRRNLLRRRLRMVRRAHRESLTQA